MKKKLTLVLALLICAMLAVPAMADGGYPLETDTTLDVWFAEIVLSSTFTSPDEVPLLQTIEEKTGVDVNWIFPAAGSDTATAYNLMMANGDLPDIIWSADIVTNATTYLNDGTIVDLTDWITEEYAPNLLAYIGDDESILKAYTTDDGRRFGFPSLCYASIWTGPYVRTDWLEECGLDIPVTIEDWTEMLTAFHDKYGAQLSTLGNFRNVFLGAYGVTTIEKDQGFYMPDGKTVTYAPACEGFRDYLTQMHAWYEAGLIDPDYLSNDQTILISKCVEGTTGAMVGYQVTGANISLAANDPETGAKWLAIPYPVLEEGGRSYTEASLTTLPMASAVTADCEDVETAVRFLDWLYSDEGLTAMNFGVEGESFEYDADGNPHYTETFLSGPEGMVEYARRYTAIVGNTPGVKTEEAAIDRNDEASNVAEATWLGDWSVSEFSSYLIPVLSPTEEEVEETTDRLSALTTYVRENTYKFITGERSLDEFDDYVNTLYDTYELDEVIAIRQAQVDRVLSR